MTKATGPSSPDRPTLADRAKSAERSGGTKRRRAISLTASGPSRRLGWTATSKASLPLKCRPSRRDHSMLSGISMRLSPSPINDRRKESLSPPASTNASPLSCALSKTSKAPALDFVPKSMDAPWNSRRVAAGAPNSNVGVAGVKSKPMPIPAAGGGCSRFKRVLDRCFSWTQQIFRIGTPHWCRPAA